MPDFSSDTMEAKGHWNNTFRMLRGKDIPIKNLMYSKSLFYKWMWNKGISNQ